jgi:hypothetical protein
MNSPLTVYKLIILYMLDHSKVPLSNAAVSDFLLESGLSNNYMSLQQALAEMSAASLVVEKADGNRTMLSITPAGRDAVSYFADSLNADLRRQCTEYLKARGMDLRTEAGTEARYLRTAGGFEVHLSVSEQGSPLLALTMTVPDEETARRMTENWPGRNGNCYRALLSELLSQNGGG